MSARIKTSDDFEALVKVMTDYPDYTPPAAWAIGWATVHAGRVVDVQFLHINNGKGVNAKAAAIWGEMSVPMMANEPRFIHPREMKQVLKTYFGPYLREPGHTNIDNAREILKRCRVKLSYGRVRVPIVAIVENGSVPATDVGDAFLRLEMESRLLIQPNEFNFDGIFKPLHIVAHTNHGPFFGEDPELIEELREEMARNGHFLNVYSLDKFPRLVDHMVPKGVRIADTARVRLGAHLASGTTVMQTGFVNFNAGTKGKSMIEGSVSQGTIVGIGSDVGRGAGFVGDLSGGGDGRNKMGDGSLLGAISEVDISIGDNCIYAMGIAVAAGTPVWLVAEERWVKGADISGAPNLLVRRSSVDGKIEALDITGRTAVELNDDLHAGELLDEQLITQMDAAADASPRP